MGQEQNESLVIQIGLDQERKDYYIFPEGTMIWPENSGRGVLTQSLQAQKLKEKIKGLSGWQAETPAHLYLDGKHWQLSKNTRFGAYSQNARKVTLKPAK